MGTRSQHRALNKTSAQSDIVVRQIGDTMTRDKLLKYFFNSNLASLAIGTVVLLFASVSFPEAVINTGSESEDSAALTDVNSLKAKVKSLLWLIDYAQRNTVLFFRLFLLFTLLMIALSTINLVVIRKARSQSPTARE